VGGVGGMGGGGRVGGHSDHGGAVAAGVGASGALEFWTGGRWC